MEVRVASEVPSAVGLARPLRKDCGRQLIGSHALTYKGCHSKLYKRIEKMLVGRSWYPWYSRNRRGKYG